MNQKKYVSAAGRGVARCFCSFACVRFGRRSLTRVCAALSLLLSSSEEKKPVRAMHEKQFSALTGVRASIWSGIPPALLLLPVCLRPTVVCLAPFFSASRSSGTDASEDEGKALTTRRARDGERNRGCAGKQAERLTEFSLFAWVSFYGSLFPSITSCVNDNRGAPRRRKRARSTMRPDLHILTSRFFAEFRTSF